MSNCSSGISVDFYWHACSDPEGHIEAAVAALMDAVDTPDRRWNPYHLRMVRAEFRDTLREAARGNLKPVDQVKPIGRKGDVLFEIRWEHINVAEVARDATGAVVFDASGQPKLEYRATRARLLHAEPLSMSVCAVGLHAHEKLILSSDKETHDEQDRQIDVALGIYNSGVGDHWGLTP